jgi:hypothetical protein
MAKTLRPTLILMFSEFLLAVISHCRERQDDRLKPPYFKST